MVQVVSVVQVVLVVQVVSEWRRWNIDQQNRILPLVDHNFVES